MNEDKAPSPDGYSAHFFKSTWSVVGNDVVAAIDYALSTGQILKAFNATAISLISNSPALFY